MLRIPRTTVRALGARARATSAVTTTTFSDVKFVKEDVSQVMAELPDFNFYEMKEPVPNPYKGVTMDRSIVLDPVAPNLVAPKFEFSKLENGLKVASIDRQGATAHLGLYVNAGSRFETSANFGVSHMVSLMAFKSTAHMSHLRTVKTLEQLGANATSSCTAGREDTVYQVDVMREYVPYVVPLMVGNVLFPRLLPWEVKAAHGKVKEHRDALAADPDAMVNDMLHKVAFCNNTVGQSPVAGERAVSYFTPETVRNFMLDHFAPQNMVLVGVNVAHSELTKWAMRSFVDYNAIPVKDAAPTKAAYTGGQDLKEGSSPFCHLAIGLESVSFSRAELAPVALMQTLLGGGSAHASGLVGSSRLVKQILQQNPAVESVSAFNTSYSDTGIFGVYGVCQAEKAGELAASAAAALKGLTSVTKDELNLAKAVLKGSISMEVDDNATLVRDLGQQLLLSGAYSSPQDFAALIDSVTEAQVQAAAKKMLNSKPSVAAYGDTHAVPSYASIEGALRA